MTPAPKTPDIIAVVVTFNRRALLERVLDALRVTPDLAEIVVVDNASTDGTTQWLASGVVADGVPVHAVTLSENLGGAGGFHEGLRLALERGADLVWLMDDDGVPVEGCLATLLEHDYDFWGPAVLAEQDPSRLCFPIRLPGRSQVVHAMADVESAAATNGGVLDDIVIPFNGVLVTRQLAEEIGLPREEFFIWGDDHEYRLRAEKAGARIATVVDAHFLHPATDDLGTPMAFGRTTYNHTPSDLKHYCMARNNVVNLRDYRGWLFVLAFVLKTLWFYAFTRPSAHRIRLSAEGIRAGLRNDFSGHRRFLQ
ncbi:glycosyltransferase family 2 protein [Nocardioides cavernaquae]|uniref:Glycosyltransferase n=1 Tax=Nocardioides cavernaquae TaxID=2321396 RepID=A0A3A5HDF8_9ACTN|nr:glycosyltransferase family 2 protein [Nocardioides cavernaquae]RJS47898.1 glycosyltransferase [Nocardioides cavernaquae]